MGHKWLQKELEYDENIPKIKFVLHEKGDKHYLNPRSWKQIKPIPNLGSQMTQVYKEAKRIWMTCRKRYLCMNFTKKYKQRLSKIKSFSAGQKLP